MTASFLGTAPTFDAITFIAQTAIAFADVTLGARAGIWYGPSLRGDVLWIEIGAESNVQDNVTIHVSRSTHPCRRVAFL